MIRHAALVILLLSIVTDNLIQCKKQQVTLSDSYLPVAMQVIAHLTDQMAFEVKDNPTVKPTARPTSAPNRPTSASNRPTSATNRPTSATNRPTLATNRPTLATNRPTSATNRPTLATNLPTSKPSYWQSTSSPAKPTTNGWWMTYTTPRTENTTPLHRPGLYAPIPPKPGDRLLPKEHFVLLPIDQNRYTFESEPSTKPTREGLLSPDAASDHEPIVDPKPPHEPLLPLSRTAEVDLDDEELSDENLQYLSQDVKETLRLANDPNDERAIDIWGEDANRKAFVQQAQSKAKLSSTNLRLLLLYDILSREAKRQKLSDYSGYSAEVMKELSDSSNGGARAQLAFVLSKMVDRKHCQHEYANNRAKEIVAELAKDESLISAEIRYLQPLVYKL